MAVLRKMVNGRRQSSISVMDRGFNYGDGVFETLLLANKKPVLFNEHYQRLAKGCSVLGITCPDKTTLQQQFNELTDSVSQNLQYVVKIIVTRGEAERGYKISETGSPNIVMILSESPAYSKAYWQNGVDICVCDTRLSGNKKLAGLKHLNRLDQVLARAEWDSDYQEGIMLDNSDNVVEGVMSNIFIVEKGVLITPLIKSVGVRGVVRNNVLKLCDSANIITAEDCLSLDRVLAADEVFLTNSVIGLWPVKKIGTDVFTAGIITKKIMQLLVNNHSVDYAASAL